jgi:transposase InsO family protein
MSQELAQSVALWRYQIIAPLLALAGPRGSLKSAIARLAAQTQQHPVRGPTRVAFGTIEEWLYRYKRHGFDALRPQVRRDQGHSRAIDDELAEQIEAMARARPELDGPGILAQLRSTLGVARALPSLSSLYRFLRARGLDQRQFPRHRDHRAYAFDLAGDCWQADVMYGPALATREGTRRQTYLLAILDDATRLVPHAQFYFEQHLRSLKDCLKQALMKRGLPRRLYCDNGQIFRSRLVLQLAARLGFQLLHTRPYRPQGRAKLERWFGTVRRAVLARTDTTRLTGLEELNRILFAWIEGEYHVTPHRGLEGETPLDRWLRLSEGIRPLPRDLDLDELFLEETTRRVAKDGTFTLQGKMFEAGPRWIAQHLTVLFDPFDLRRVLFRCGDSTTHEAFPVDLGGNRRLRRNAPGDNSPGDTP